MKLDCYYDYNQWQVNELLSNLVFEVYRTLTYHVILSGTFFAKLISMYSFSVASPRSF